MWPVHDSLPLWTCGFWIDVARAYFLTPLIPYPFRFLTLLHLAKYQVSGTSIPYPFDSLPLCTWRNRGTNIDSLPFGTWQNTGTNIDSLPLWTWVVMDWSLHFNSLPL